MHHRWSLPYFNSFETKKIIGIIIRIVGKINNKENAQKYHIQKKRKRWKRNEEFARWRDWTRWNLSQLAATRETTNNYFSYSQPFIAFTLVKSSLTTHNFSYFFSSYNFFQTSKRIKNLKTVKVSNFLFSDNIKCQQLWSNGKPD